MQQIKKRPIGSGVKESDSIMALREAGSVTIRLHTDVDCCSGSRVALAITQRLNPQKKAAPVSSSGKKPAQADRCETMQQVLEYLFEAGRLDVLEHRSSRRQPIRIRERDVERPISSRRTVDRAVRIVLSDSLGRVIERNQRSHKVKALPAPVFEKAREVMHAAIQARFIRGAITRVRTVRQGRQIVSGKDRGPQRSLCSNRRQAAVS